MENKNGQGIFYGVIGVATLVVAIIGATFAYFSAAATTEYTNDIAGGTNDALGGALTVNVTKVDLGGNATSGDNLVPTNITASNTGLITGALNAKCVQGGYTGCHLYRITARSTQDVAAASLTLDDLTVTLAKNTENSANVADWKYTIFTATESSGTWSNVSLVTGGNGNFNLPSAFDMHTAATTTGAMTANTDYVYYLMVFLFDDDTEQNNSDANDATGTYAGHVSLSAGGTGRITASFTASA